MRPRPRVGGKLKSTCLEACLRKKDSVCGDSDRARGHAIGWRREASQLPQREGCVPQRGSCGAQLPDLDAALPSPRPRLAPLPRHAPCPSSPMARPPAVPCSHLLIGGAENAVNLLELVLLVLPREERREAADLVEYAADAPHVHLRAVVAVGEQALGRAVPARRNVLRERVLAVASAARAKVRKLKSGPHVVARLDEDVFGLDVAVKDAALVHMSHRSKRSEAHGGRRGAGARTYW